MLIETLADLDLLRRATRSLAGRGGGAGVDGVDARAFASRGDGALRDLVHEVRDGRYRPGRLLVRTRAKPDGRVRVLGIPCVRDRVLQTAVLQVATQRLDATLHPHGHGYRPGRGVSTALADLSRQVRPAEHLEVLLTDIEDLFGSLDLVRLERVVRAAWSDPTWHQLVVAWSAAWGRGGRGVPQGAPLSPMLSNLYLTATLDRGLSCMDGRLGLAGWIRYADDLTLVGSRRGAAMALGLHVDALAGAAGLRLSGRKTMWSDLRASQELPGRVLGCSVACVRGSGGLRLSVLPTWRAP